MKESDLIKRVLKIRFSDTKEKKELCRQILALPEAEQSAYGRAFANVYLFDSSLALGEYGNCDFLLSNAIYLCRQNKFEDLLLTLCNLSGLYYLKMNDEQTALEYYLEGLSLAERLNESEMLSKLNNNIGFAFAGRGDWETAKTFFEKAVQILDDYKESKDGNLLISDLSNLAEVYQQVGDMEKTKEILERCSKLSINELYYQIKVSCVRCSYYARVEEREKCLAEAEKILQLGLEDFGNKYFLCDILIQLVENMLDIGEYEWAKNFFSVLEKLKQDAPVMVQYRSQCVRIRYLKLCKKEEELKKAYRDYYAIVTEMSENDNRMCAQSMIYKIQLNEVLAEQEMMKSEKKELENASQLDELTQIYNRRYFNKLVSKVLQNKDLKTKGFVMIDIDYFKQYNDEYGHFMGDKVLQEVARLLVDLAPEGIDVSRYGGDEFVCLCQNVKDKDLDEYVKTICNGVRELEIVHEKSKCSKRLSVSIGYCNEKRATEKSADQLLLLADNALYMAKKKGRNGFYKMEEE